MALVFLTLAAISLYLGWRESRLQRSCKTITARVVESKERHGSRDSYRVRYRFLPDSTDLVYSFSDPLWGRDSFVEVSPSGWKQAQASGFIPIVYESSDPWNNHPVQSTGLTNDVRFWGATGVFMLLLATALLLVRFRYSVRYSVRVLTSKSGGDVANLSA